MGASTASESAEELLGALIMIGSIEGPLPSIPNLARMLDINPNTANKVLRNLAEKGLVRKSGPRGEYEAGMVTLHRDVDQGIRQAVLTARYSWGKSATRRLQLLIFAFMNHYEQIGTGGDVEEAIEEAIRRRGGNHSGVGWNDDGD